MKDGVQIVLLNSHPGGRCVLRGIQQARDVVVDWLGHSLAILEIPDLLIHEVKVLGLGVQGCDTLLLPAGSVQAVVVIQADDSGHV